MGPGNSLLQPQQCASPDTLGSHDLVTPVASAAALAAMMTKRRAGEAGGASVNRGGGSVCGGGGGGGAAVSSVSSLDLRISHFTPLN